tara:strand:+ start:200 stop:502 length:303 start_codon:yes stop_codon:yes gene_type:complete
MPLEASAFPAEVQVAFFVYSYLSDRWEGMSGSYMGKDWSHIDTLFKLFEIDEPKVILYFMKMYEGIIVNHRAQESEQKRKAEDRKRQQASGKTYTHNVKG